MKVLIACEESQAVCKAFRARGHDAYSCDVQDCSGGHPEWHIKCDALELLKISWDMIIAHPPCTFLACSSAVNLFRADHTIKDTARYEKGLEAKKFFLAFLNCGCPRVAVENPVPLKIFGLPQYTQIIEPYMFGEPWRKRTCLWLRGLPRLVPTKIVSPRGLWVGSTSGRRDHTIYSRYELPSKRNPKIRCKTFPGIAEAMAEQWGKGLE